jgi:hypothetical protein
MIIVLILVLILCFGGGFWGQAQYGAAGWSPLGLVLLVLVVLYLTGHLPR